MTVVGSFWSVVWSGARAGLALTRGAVQDGAAPYKEGGPAGVDAGGGDRLALAVLAQYRMATTEQTHLILNPEVRIEQTRRRLAKLRAEGLVDRIILPQRGRLRVWFPTPYGVQITGEFPELRGRRPSRTVSDRTAVRLRVGHALAVTETGLAFLQDARRRGDLCRPLDWIPEVYHPVGGGEAVIPDALLFYRSGREGGDGSMLRAFVEVDRATMGPERLAAKLNSYARLHGYVPAPAPGRRQRQAFQEPWQGQEEWRRHYPLFPRLLFVLDGTGPAGITTRIRTLRAAAEDLALTGFLREVPVLAAPLVDVLKGGPAEPVWHPVQDPGSTVSWTHSPGLDTPHTAPARPGAEATDHHDHEPDHSWSQRWAAR
ncbi:replication-relaxation family protein [Streptomyces sp. NRRL S-813]|uniref:replication-relaxation family protein n=1 Tax=Streptomyces sp. NRRL S-813 TaxID=1463919 RepID=UPI001F2A8D48|nr:replication-relaxation family protein [Streptomyces sp. NRRL S-813]